MAQNDNKPKHTGHSTPVDQETIKAWINNQTLELQNQKGEQQIRLRQLDANTRLAEKSLELQKTILENQGPDFRKSITRIAYISIALIAVILLFLGYCLYTGNKEFAYKFCQGVGYIVTTGLGYYFGKKSGKDNISSSPQEQVF